MPPPMYEKGERLYRAHCIWRKGTRGKRKSPTWGYGQFCMATCEEVPKTKAEQRAQGIIRSMALSACPHGVKEMYNVLASFRAAMLKPKDDW